MKLEIVHVSNGNAHVYGGIVIHRAISFNERYGVRADPEFIFAELSAQMTVQDPHTLIQVATNDAGLVVAHGITHLQIMYGVRNAMIYQLEADEGEVEGRAEMLHDGLEQIKGWAKTAGCETVRAWAMNTKLAEVFKKYEFEDKDYHFIEVGI